MKSYMQNIDFIFQTIAFNISPETGGYRFIINLFQMFKYLVLSESIQSKEKSKLIFIAFSYIKNILDNNSWLWLLLLTL